MSLIHEQSSECTTSPLEWFQIQPTQTAIEKTYDVEYRPLTTIRDHAPIEFLIPASTEEYLDLKNSKLYVTIQVTSIDNNADLTANDEVAPINDIFNGLWSNVELFLKDRLISHSNNTHGYTSIISHLVHDSEESMLSERGMRLIYKDTPSQMDISNPKLQNLDGKITGYNIDPTDGAELVAGIGNKGLHQRYLHTRLSRDVSLIGSLRIDLFEQERYIPTGVDVKLRFHRQKYPYMLMSANNAYKIIVKDCYLMVRKVKPSPGVLLGHEDALQSSNARFPITRKECKVLAIPQGFTTYVKDNIFLGQLPKRVIIGMVDNDAFSGACAKNPYNFKHYNVNYMQLFTDGEPVLPKPLQPDITNRKYLSCYETLFKVFDRVDGEKSSIIKRVDWDKGYSLFAFDLTPDYDGGDRYSLIKHGNLRLEINFAQALGTTVNVIVYAEFDNIIEITQARNIIYDYQ